MQSPLIYEVQPRITSKDFTGRLDGEYPIADPMAPVHIHGEGSWISSMESRGFPRVWIS